MGYFLVFWSLFSYGALGVCHKLAERKHCRTQPLAAMLLLSASIGMSVFVFVGTQRYTIPARGFYLAIICGAIALCALLALQEALKHGKIATSWLIINLSSAIPTIGSILVYHEPISLKKIFILGLIAVSIVLVWMDRLDDLRRAEKTGADAPIPTMSGAADASLGEEI